jgi:hypothetical protein
VSKRVLSEVKILELWQSLFKKTTLFVWKIGDALKKVKEVRLGQLFMKN